MSKKTGVKDAFRSRSSKAGGVSLIIIAVVLAIIIAVNLIIPKLPSKVTSFDLSSAGKFSVGEITKGVINSLNDNVNIYYVVEGGNEDSSVKSLLKSYDSASSKVSTKIVDPIVNPKFTAKFTDEKVESGSIIVACGERSKVIPGNDLYEYSVDYNTYQYQPTAFAAENVITNGITFVTSENLPKISFLTGHGEADLDPSFSSALSNANYEIDTLKLAAQGGVPEGTDCVAVVAPKLDFSKEDVKALNDYVAKGGKIYMASDDVDLEKYPNLVSFLKGYGIELVKGILVELDTNYCYSYNGMSINYMLLPHTDNHEITKDLTNYYVMFPQTQGFTIAENLPEGVKVDPIVSSSEKAYSSINIEEKTSSEKEEGDIEVDGTFKLGAAVSYNEGKIVYYSNSRFMESTVNQSVSGANSILFIKSFGWLCDTPDSVSIPSKSVSYDVLTMPSMTANVLKTVMVGVVPALLIIAGIAVVILRKKR